MRAAEKLTKLDYKERVPGLLWSYWPQEADEPVFKVKADLSLQEMMQLHAAIAETVQALQTAKPLIRGEK